jgi:hypothetical protein
MRAALPRVPVRRLGNLRFFSQISGTLDFLSSLRQDRMGACQTISNAKKLDSCTVVHHLETTKCKNINRTNKVSYTKGIQIAFIINPSWIQGKWEGSYRDRCTSMGMPWRFAKSRQARPDFATTWLGGAGRAASGSGPEIVSTWATGSATRSGPSLGPSTRTCTRTTCTGTRRAWNPAALHHEPLSRNVLEKLQGRQDPTASSRTTWRWRRRWSCSGTRPKPVCIGFAPFM